MTEKRVSIIYSDFDLPLAKPPPLDAFGPKPLLSNDECDQFGTLQEFEQIIHGGCVNYIHSPIPDAVNKKSEGSGTFDEQKQQFLHKVALEFSETGECKNCNNCTIKFCKGCKDFFCSLHCLKEHNREKSGCFCITSSATNEIKIPNRNAIGRGAKLLSPRVISPTYPRSVASSESDVQTNGIRTVERCDLPLNNKLVAITTVVSHNIVFLRPCEPKDNDKYFMYLNDVNEVAKTAEPLDEMPQNGDIVLAEHDGCYHRALVAQVEKDEVVVAFLELGNLAKKSLKAMKKLSDNLKYVKRFTFKATLSGVDEAMKSDKCLTYLQQMVEKEIPLKFLAKGNVSASMDVPCELLVSDTNENVNGKLSMLNRIKIGKPLMEDDIPVKLLDDNVTEVIVIDNSLATHGLVTIIRMEHTTDMYFMHQRIQEYCKEDYESPFTPRQLEICLAKCDDQWYRAKLEKSFGDMNPVMLFIDFALYTKVNIHNMRPMPAELALPRYSVLGEIGGVTSSTDLEKLREKLRLLSKVSVSKVEQENPGEPTIYFTILEVADENVA